MANVGFFTPITFNGRYTSCSEGLLELVDSYFYLGGRKAFVIPAPGPARAVLMQETPELLMSALKVASYFTLVLPTVMLIAKVILRAVHHFEALDARVLLERDVVIPNEAALLWQIEVPELAADICAGRDNPALVWYRNNRNLVFGLRDFPDFVFKMRQPGFGGGRNGHNLHDRDMTEDRFANMVHAKEVCLANGLDQLVVPGARKIYAWLGNAQRPIIVERKQNIQCQESAQEHLWRTRPVGVMMDTARQLTTFIVKTGFSDVDWRNIPILHSSPADATHVALIDLEEMEGARTGIFGSSWAWQPRRGLIRCLGSRELVGIAIAEARRHGITLPAQEEEELRRRAEDERAAYNNLQGFYLRNNLLNNPRRPLEVDVSTLELNLDEQGTYRVPTGCDQDGDIVYRDEPFTLGKCATDVIAHINHTIANVPDGVSTKGMRSVLLDPNDEYSDLYRYQSHGPLLERVIYSLVRHDHLFEQTRDGHGYHLQA
ncbi:MAG: hypothetical protein ACHQT8_07985 [Chlamydiales bacterium]